MEWSREGLERLNADAGVPRLGEVVDTIEIMVCDFSPYMIVPAIYKMAPPQQTDELAAQYVSAMCLLKKVKSVFIKIDLGLEGKRQQYQDALDSFFQDITMKILGSVLSYYEDRKLPLCSLGIHCQMPRPLITRSVYRGVVFGDLATIFPATLGAVEHLLIGASDDQYPTTDMLAFFRCLKSVESLIFRTDNMDLLYDSQFQHIRFPALQRLDAIARFGRERNYEF